MYKVRFQGGDLLVAHFAQLALAMAAALDHSRSESWHAAKVMYSGTDIVIAKISDRGGITFDMTGAINAVEGAAKSSKEMLDGDGKYWSLSAADRARFGSQEQYVTDTLLSDMSEAEDWFTKNSEGRIFYV